MSHNQVQSSSLNRKAYSGSSLPLSQLCIEVTDCHHSTPNWTDSGRIVARSNNIKKGRFLLNGLSYTDEATYQERIARSKPEPGDLIITREAPMGEVCIIPDGVECCLGQRLVLIKPDHNKISSNYLLYALLSEYVQKQIWQSDKTGSTVSNLRIPVLKSLQIPLVEPKEKISKVLSSIDQKIDANNKINAQLEAMAKTLYDYWFVQFDFPDESSKPYKSSGGKMVYDEILKREIPEGWQRKNLCEITPVSTSQLNPSDQPNTEFKHYSIPSYDETGSYCLEKGSAIGSNKFIVSESDILVSKLNPKFNRVLYPLTENNLICSTEFVVWRSKNIELKNFLYSIATSPHFILHCVQSASGTSNSHKRVNPDVMMSYALAYDQDTAMQYGEKIHSLMKLIIKNQIESRKLIQLHNWLLPMLMNGQVKVENEEN